jgi:diguanylate cyclase (GGDEF)-like protein
LLGIDRPDERLNVRHWLSVLAEDERDRAQRLLAETIAQGGEFEFKFRRDLPGPDGEPVQMLTSGFAEHDDEGKIVRIIGIVADVTERLRNEERLRYIADHDPLTGLANRRRFNDLLSHHVEMCRRYGMEGAVMMLDLDGLKRVNDEHGHAAGDELITSTADALRNRLRTSDLGARIGGDEFAILLTRTTRKGALSTAESILKAIEPASAALREFGIERVHGSIGVVMIEDAPRADAEELLTLADDAMYEAKRGGRARVNMYRPPLRRPTAA